MARKGKSRPYRVCAAYDTETCNYGQGKDSRAYVVCYQVNDLRACDLCRYEAGRTDDIRIYRTEAEMLAYLDGLMAWGKDSQVVPVVCAYNLLFDLKSLLYDLRASYKMAVSAQSSTSVYTLDLLGDDGKVALRFWDCFYLDQRGLAAMGEVAGLPKATGDWDYSKARTPETELTPEEAHYASRDVQVIPAYLRYLLEANSWLRPEALGVRVVTKTSLVRQMAKNEIGPRKCGPKSKLTEWDAFTALCAREAPRDFGTYALRKACFRGGFTFTSAATACVPVRNVASLDVTSMHHTFMAARVPVRFVKLDAETLQRMAERIVATPRADVLARYCRPFQFAMHAQVEFSGLRLKEGSAFAAWGIALLARGKFREKLERSEAWAVNEAHVAQTESVLAKGWHDAALSPVYAFGKLYRAELCRCYLSEVELWCVSRVYDWDSMRVIQGEATSRYDLPPDYVGLQSNMLFEAKSAMKDLCGHYDEGVPYARPISPLVPTSLAEEAKAGKASAAFLASYYQSTVKGMFNGIYGTQAQDVYKPDFLVDAEGDVCVDRAKIATEGNFGERQPKVHKVLYTYGLRIVGRSRMHLVIGIELLFEALGDRVTVTGGDTDSLKVACSEGVADADLLAALGPLHDAADVCIRQGYSRIRAHFPDLASGLADVGHFDVERCGRSTRYDWHMELWPKARVSIDSDGEPHVTCAGLSRPAGAYTIVDRMRELIAEEGPEAALLDGIGYDVYVGNSICHALERTDPPNDAIFDAFVRDWRGDVSHVRAHEVCALYDVGRMLGDMTRATNAESVRYLAEEYGREVRTGFRALERG